MINIIWALATIYLIFHFLIFHSRLAFYRASKPRPFRKPVSVIICARNEAENLKQNLPKVLEQDFKIFEVIVVNDGSTDETAEVLSALKKTSRKLKILNHEKPEDSYGKRSALRAGIEKARNPYLLFTDADCAPVSDNWLKGMVGRFKTKEIILGMSPYKKEKGFTNFLVQWETLQSAQQYLSFALVGLPYMGVGRNLAYTKGIYRNSDQLKSSYRTAGGDDDLFIGSVAKANNTAIHIDEDAFTLSEAPKSFAAWWKQKRRHLSTAYQYQWYTKMLLGLYGLAQLLFYLLIPFIIISGASAFFIPLLMLKFAVQLSFLIPSGIKLKQGHALWLMPVWELFTTIFISIIHIQNLITPKAKRWN